jgi:DNA-binding response OmpR family regulator
VEDFYLMAKQISTAFQADALPTTLVTKGEDALKELTENQDSYFCVLLDLGLPDLNGVTILKWMAREKIQIPVIVISGQLTTETLLELKTLEVGQVFSKPLDLSDLLTKVRQLKP